MNPFYDYVFNLKFLFIAAGVKLLLCLLYRPTRQRLLASVAQDGQNASTGTQLRPSGEQARLRFVSPLMWWMRTLHGGLVSVSVGYFVIAAACKYSQYKARLLNGEDFWLFEDMLRWMSRGEPYVTRFAGHAAGPIQHGAVHAYLSLWAAVPFAIIFSPLTVCILMVPLALALGGYAIGRMSLKSSNSKLLVLGLPIAFWMSEWTNRTLNYDTHPEAFYIPLVFLVYVASLKLFERETFKTWALFLASWIFLAAMKQDAIVYGLLLWAFLFVEKRLRAKAAVASLSIVVVLFALMTEIISQFKTGAIGVSTLELSGIMVPITHVTSGAVNLNGYAMSSFSGVASLISMFFRDGVALFFWRGIKYLFTSQFALITLMAPWLLRYRSFWILVVPFAILVGGMHTPMAQLQVYNGVMFISLFWLSLCIEISRQKFDRRYLLAAFTWTFAFCALHGAAAPQLYFESQLSREISREAREVTSKQTGLGIVSSRLLRDVDESHVWADRVAVPEDPLKDAPSFVSFILYTKSEPSFEFAQSDFNRWKEWALAGGEWRLAPGRTVDLLIRKNRALP